VYNITTYINNKGEITMAFFEDLGKKITDAGQNLTQQTKNFADVTQLNGAISEAEKKITQIYTSLGQIYFENNKDDATVDGANFIADIKTLKAEIQANRDKINEIKGIVKCDKCGADVPSTSAFCSSCGNKIVVPVATPVATPSGRVCPNCNAIVAEGHMFCNSCGTKLEAAPAAPVTPVTPAEPATSTVEGE
jgi:rRNA maturation endonuclease Nob1